MWIQIRLLLQEQSDLDLHCLSKRLLNDFSRRQKRTTFVMIGALRLKDQICFIDCLLLLLRAENFLLGIIHLLKTAYK